MKTVATLGAVALSVAALVVSFTNGSGPSKAPSSWSVKASNCWTHADAAGSRHCATGNWRHVNAPSK
jgi:hypothetical protein